MKLRCNCESCVAAYLAGKDQTGYNIIVVDWGALAIPNAPYIAPIFYPIVVNNVATTGQRVGDFLVWLNKLNAVDSNRVHIIGFSLGSHIAGKAGDVVKQATGQPVARITGELCAQKGCCSMLVRGQTTTAALT